MPTHKFKGLLLQTTVSNRGITYVHFQKWRSNVREPRPWLWRQRDMEVSVRILRATIWVSDLILSSLVTKYARRDAKMSSKNCDH